MSVLLRPYRSRHYAGSSGTTPSRAAAARHNDDVLDILFASTIGLFLMVVAGFADCDDSAVGTARISERSHRVSGAAFESQRVPAESDRMADLAITTG